MAITVGPDGVTTVTVTAATPQSTPTSNTGTGAVGGNLPLVSTVQQALNTGSGGGGLPLTSSVQQVANSVAQPASPTASQDMRIRLSPLNPQDVIQAGGILSPLTATNGMIFPYTPTINFTQAVNYMDLQLVHSNTDYAAYTRTPSATISVSGKFTVQNQAEGAYALACLHFLRSVSKMYFGETDQQAGLPPPILVFSGYGNYMFGTGGNMGTSGGMQGLRVILKNHNWSFDDSVDSVIVNVPASSPQPATGGTLGAQATNLAYGVNGGAGSARLPALFTLSCELMVVQTPQRMRKTFNFKAFASGSLMQNGNTGWI